MKFNPKYLVYAGAILSIIASGLIVYSQQYELLVLPFVLAVGSLAVFRLDWILLIGVALTPLSFTLNFKDVNLGVSLPTEPIFAGVLVLIFLRFLQNGRINFSILKEPLSLALLFNLIWLFITALTSSLPVVSLKYVLVRMWFVVPLYFVMIQVLRDRKKIEGFYWAYTIPLTIAAIYTLVIHSQYGFSKDTSTWVMFPLFKEHTSYGAALAMFIPAITGLFFLSKRSLFYKFVVLGLAGVLYLATVLSYTRAAWVSVLAALAVYVVIKLRIKIGYLVVAGLIVLGGLAANQDLIMSRFEGNQAVSSDDLGEHVQSISNISTDASNTERINRWKSALRMFEQRPFFGWGPGTYMFQYAPFQKPWEKTIISTNSGNRGNAHSEYIGPLAESGVFGLVSVLIIIFFMMHTGITTYYKLEDENLKRFILFAILGLVTYFTHGFLNNFLDMDKLAVPVFGFSAIIVAIKHYHLPKPNANPSS